MNARVGLGVCLLHVILIGCSKKKIVPRKHQVKIDIYIREC